jgi:hypothetical protein
MKKLAVLLACALALVLALLALLVFGTRQPSQIVSVAPTNNAAPLIERTSSVTNSSATPSSETDLSTINSQLSTPPTSLASRAVAGIPATNEIRVLPPATVLDNARVVIHNYHEAFGENPIGTNPEITAALLGKNPKQINFVTTESGLRVNDQGEMLDAWGTPLFFHQVSSKEMEIRSAGEDKKMWTFDDLVTR